MAGKNYQYYALYKGYLFIITVCQKSRIHLEGPENTTTKTFSTLKKHWTIYFTMTHMIHS